MAEENKKGQYTKIQEKASRGEYSLVVPFDYMILNMLPTVGTLFAGLYPLGEQASNIAKKLPKGPDGKSIAVSTVQTRLRILHEQNLIMKHMGLPGTGSRGAIWQKTETGESVLKEWEDTQGGNKKS